MIKKGDIKIWWLNHKYISRFVAFIFIICFPLYFPIAYTLEFWVDIKKELYDCYKYLVDLVKWNVED